ncbi:MFS transporter [Dictyobacter sp. S3.2.2.5]|uniref:MFS transporter n=1 Tax=Dictyobacter halimunensis TaxID=3026934 RepID=A0ABQ6FIS7_9CHLR|nr:MFS transporter [Dictyobacter sp. S3.2.2.5]
MQSTDSGGKQPPLPEAVRGETQHTRGLPRMLIAFRHRNFRWFFFGQMISLIGTWMQTAALAWLVLELTHSAFLLALVGVLQYLPVMIFSLFGGVLADRLPKRSTLFFTQSLALLQATVMWGLVAMGAIQVWEILCLAAVLGLSTAFDQPTRQTFVLEMVGQEDLTNAVALNSAITNVARVLGPGLGGILIAWLGVAPLFLLNALSFLAVIFGLLMIDLKALHVLPGNPTGEQRLNVFQSAREGLSYVWHVPSLALPIGVLGAVMLFGINFNVMLPLFATDVLHAGSIGYGFLYSAFGIGALFSSLWLAWGNQKPNIHALLIAALIFCALEIAFALSHFYLLSLPLIAGIGFAQVVMGTIANITIQTVAPSHLRGRVMSVYLLVYSGGMPLGNLFAGGLAMLFGASISLLIGGILSLVAALAGWIRRRPAEQSLAASINALNIK